MTVGELFSLYDHYDKGTDDVYFYAGGYKDYITNGIHIKDIPKVWLNKEVVSWSTTGGCDIEVEVKL